MKTNREFAVVTVTVRGNGGSATTKIYDATVEEVCAVLGAGIESEVAESPEWKTRGPKNK